MKKFALVLLPLLLTSCGEDGNINSIFTSSEHEEALDALVYKAERLYDDGEYEQALETLEKAGKINNTLEDVNVLKSYVYLSLAKIDAFQITKNLINLSNDKSSNNDDAADTLGKLSSIVGISKDDIEQYLGDEEKADTLPDEFQAIPLYLPRSAEEARTSESLVVSNLNKAIATICPYVNDGAKPKSDADTNAAADYRHTEEQCQKFAGERYLNGKSHLVWILAHLTEALAFHSVVLYTEENQSSPSLLRRADALEKIPQTLENLSTYVSAVKSLSDSIEQILPTEKEKAAKSMLTGIFNDLNSVQLGLAEIAGVPDSVKKSLNDAITTLTEQKEKLQQSASTDDTQSEDKDLGAAALKDQLTSTIKTQVGDQVTELLEKQNDATAEEKKQLVEACAAYEIIAETALQGCDGITTTE